MKNSRTGKRAERRKGEKGAAMVTVLMITFILLVASAGLLLETSMNSANVTDATAEQQAYNAAESGIQSALDVLRGNVDPDINFVKALDPATSNEAGDTSTAPRLSKWLEYSSAYPDRVVLGGNTDGYLPRTGYAFGLSLSDPDYTGASVTFSTSGRIDGVAGIKVFTGTGINTLTVIYNPRGAHTAAVTGGTINDNLGSFSIVKTGTGSVTIPDTRFEISYDMTDPYEETRVIRGYIEGGTITSTADVKFLFDSPAYMIMGSKISLTGGTSLTSPTRYRYTGSSSISITASISPVEPHRILIRSTGYGPRGAQKQLEAIVQKNFFNGLTAPATLTLVGSSSGMVFNPGTSAAMEYSGDDVVSNVIIPPIGTTNEANLAVVKDELCDCPPQPYNGKLYGTPSNVTTEMPKWLESAAKLDVTVQGLKNIANSSGRYFANGGSVSGGVGDNLNAKGITFVDGDMSLSQPGGGILVVTGTLTLNGAFKFNGLIIVTGPGGIVRNGGGNGVIQGNVVIAPYNKADVNAGFLAPKYDLSGGGNSEIVYNSSSVANGLTAVGNFVLGVVEK